MGGNLRGKIADYQELLYTEYKYTWPHWGEFGDHIMTKMVERGIQLILSAVNPEISELSILGGGGFKYTGNEDICPPDRRLPDNKLLLKVRLDSPGFFPGSNGQTDTGSPPLGQMPPFFSPMAICTHY